MTTLFDAVAGKFAGDIDQSIRSGSYVRGDLFMRLARRHIEVGNKVLDYGCGPGRLSMLLARGGLIVHGVDTSAGMIDEARRLSLAGGGQVSFSTIEKPEEATPSGAYDAVVCSSVIEYVDDAAGLLRRFHDTLRAGGHLVISFANRSSCYRRKWMKELSDNPMAPSQRHVWNWPEFKRLLREGGFESLGTPRYFESPADRPPLGALLRRSPYFGSLGVVAARRV